MKPFRIKKDVNIYHPAGDIILPQGCIFLAEREPILVRHDNVIMTKREEINEYIEEIGWEEYYKNLPRKIK